MVTGYRCSITAALSSLLGQTWTSHKSEFSDWKNLKQREIDVVESCALLDVTNVRDWSDYTTLQALSGVESLSGSQRRCWWLPPRNLTNTMVSYPASRN